MSPSNGPVVRGYVSLTISCLALVVALSGTAYAALGKGEVKTKNLARGAVSAAKLRDGAVTAAKVAPGAVSGPAVADGSLTAADLADGSVGAGELADGSVDTGAILDRTIRLADLGGPETNQTTTLGSAVAIAAGACQNLSLRTLNPAPAGYLGSMVVGTITTSTGGPVVSNSGAILPTLLTGTTQNGVVIHLTVCAGSMAQTLPVGSIVTWSLIAP